VGFMYSTWGLYRKGLYGGRYNRLHGRYSTMARTSKRLHY